MHTDTNAPPSADVGAEPAAPRSDTDNAPPAHVPTQTPSPTPSHASEPSPAPVRPDGGARGRGDLERELAEARAALAHAQRRRLIDRHVARAGAVDVDAAALLVEETIGAPPRGDSAETPRDVDPGRLVADAVDRLRRERPALFRAGPAPLAGSAMSARPADEPDDGLARLADDARAAGGDRRSTLRYLLRREAHRR